ncbi:MAG TPA: hypothetical protein VF092_16625 [Longimicrobium sp.]
MKKLKLDLAALGVESFAADAASRAEMGTVEAQVTSINGTCVVSCYHTACIAQATCGSTCECG